MTRNDEFLKLYKQLEITLGKIYPDAESPMKEYIHVLEDSSLREEKDKAELIDFLRIVRNNLTHRNVNAYVEVSEKTNLFLKKENEALLHPLTAKEMMTPSIRLLKGTLTSVIGDLLSSMEKYGYSYAPIVNEAKRVIGVMSPKLLTRLLLQEEGLDLKKTFADLVNKYKDLGKNDYPYLAVSTSREEAVKVFNGKGKQIPFALITEHGNAEEQLLGILTPGDILKNEDSD